MKTTPFILPLLFVGTLTAQDNAAKADPLAGHSYHGEVFNEGPRQAAVLIPGTGEVDFKVTTASEEAQRFFNQGVGQLHGYWFFEAERSFRQVAAIDPDCAMAYWGMAMANFKNDTRGKKFIDEAGERKDKADAREKLWIDGLAAYFKDPKTDAKKRLRDYTRSLEKIVMAHPDDLEAKAVLLHQVFYNSGKELPISSYYAMNLLAEEILTKAPNHPANHFQIHLWDKEDAVQALKAAANCGPAAPGIAHMWHMPGHIYSKLHRHTDAAWQQEASARVDHAHMMRYRIVPDQIHNFAHNNEWLIRNFNSLGQLDRSVDLALNMISLPRLAKFKKEGEKSNYDPDGSSWHYGRQRLRDSLVRFEQWEELIRLSGDVAEKSPALLAPDGKSITEMDFHRYVGIAKFESGDHAGGVAHLADLEKRLAAKKAEQDKAVADAKAKATAAKKDEKGIKESSDAAAKTFEKAVNELANPVKELTVYRHLTAAEPDKAAALALLPELKDLAKWRHASLWQRAGNGKEALKLADEAVKSEKNEVLALATQVRLLHENGEKEKAKAAFTSLRTVAGHADADLAIFTPLAAIAKKFGFPEKWQTPAEPAKDLGPRPSLDTLGPFRWSPPSAPDFTLSDANGKETTLSTLRTRPVVAIFFLGKGCLHCMEQLNAFAPLQKKYDEAGIDLVAISTNPVAELKETLAGDGETTSPFPFPLLSDASLVAFKDYRAYDDFEKQPLHGTFLIDRSGHIRWQEIGYEPFMNPEWLLEECRRLLSLEAPES
jgi:peroxiredoxin